MRSIKEAREGSWQFSEQTCSMMQIDIATWFPHTMVRQWSAPLLLAMTCGILALTACKLSDGGWSWNEADCADALGAFLPWQSVSCLMVAGAGMKLTVLMHLGHSCLGSQ